MSRSRAAAGRSVFPNRQNSPSASGESRSRSGLVSSRGSVRPQQWAKFRGCGGGLCPAGTGRRAGWDGGGWAGGEAPFRSGSLFPGRPERHSARSARSALPP